MSLFPRNFAVWGTATGGLTEAEAGAPYRYMLTRERLLPSGPIMMVIGVNPSTGPLTRCYGSGLLAPGLRCLGCPDCHVF